jgi:hypothetical protein
MAPKTMKLVTIPIRISSVIYAIFGLGSFALLLIPLTTESNAEILAMRIILSLMFVMCAGLVVFLEIVIRALKGGKYWAWIAGICIAGLYIPSIFMVLGIIILVGLLNNEVKSFCAKKDKRIEHAPAADTSSPGAPVQRPSAKRF